MLATLFTQTRQAASEYLLSRYRGISTAAILAIYATQSALARYTIGRSSHYSGSICYLRPYYPAAETISTVPTE